MRIILSALALLALPARAGDPFACVADDVVAAFLGNSYSGSLPEYSTEVPDEFTRLPLPEGFSLVGSRSEGSKITVVYRSADDKQGAYRAAIDVLEDKGWRELRRAGDVRGGFQSEHLPSHAFLCREGARFSLTVTAVKRASRTLVSYLQGTTGVRCDYPGVPSWAAVPGEDQMPPMPALSLPRGVTARHPGGSGGDGQFTSFVDVSAPGDRQAVAAHLETQIREQGWQRQGSWENDAAAGSTWTRSINEARDAVATLLLMQTGAGTARLSISVTWGPAPAGGVRWADPAAGPGS